MNKILGQQRLLLKRIAKHHGQEHNPTAIPGITNGAIVQYIKDQAFFLSEEVTEIMLAIGEEDRAILKPWSVKHKDIVNKEFESTDAVRSEAIDMLCFCMNICIAVGLRPETIEKEYNKVLQKNIHRQENGY
jgi:NTP pyrophosphatase (non-canonical NTP hydrolase)